MKPHHIFICTGATSVLVISAVFATMAHAQTIAPQPAAPMAKPPPAAASGAASATNPDNMPVKKPDKPTNDKIIRNPPASGAEPK